MNMKQCIAAAVGAVAVLGGCAGSQDYAPVAVATYNIRGAHGLDYVFDIDRTAAAITRLNAETVALNEVDNLTDRCGNLDITAMLGERTPLKYHFFIPAFKLPGGMYGSALLSRYPIEPVEVFPIPDNDDETRAAGLVRIAAPVPYYVVVTHYPYEDNLNDRRVTATEKIAEKLSEHNAFPAIVMGDLNVSPDAPPIQRFRELGFKVSNDAAPDELTYPADKPDQMIDYIIFYPADAVEIIDHGVAFEPEASDHRPVFTVFSFR